MISPENRNILDIELEYMRLNDTTALYLCRRVREQNKEINLLDDALTNIEEIVDSVYEYIDRSEDMPEKEHKALHKFLDAITEENYTARERIKQI